MKLKDWLSQILPTATFTDADLPVVLSASALNDIEMPDAVVSKFNTHYMTPDRAANDTGVMNAVKGKIWGRMADEIEREFKNFLPHISQEYQDRYNAIPKDQKDGIYARAQILSEAVGKISDSKQTDDVKQAAEKFRAKEKELRDQVAAMEKKTKELEEGFTSKLSDYKIDFELRKKYQDWIPKLDQSILKTDKQREFLINQNIADLRENFILEFDKDNAAQINFLKKDRTAYYEGNDLVSLDQYIEKQLDEFTVKNPGGTTQTPATKKVIAKQVDQPVRGMSAREMRMAAAPAE